MDRHDATTVRTGALGRGLDALSLDSITKASEVQAARFQEALGEYEEQFQTPVTAEVSAVIGWAEIDYSFRIPFLPATGMRDSPFKVPQFSFGYEMVSGDPVMMCACVRRWVRERGGGSGGGSADAAVTGAVVNIGVCDPGADLPDGPRKVSLVAHITFQGFGAPYDDPEDGQSDNVEVR